MTTVKLITTRGVVDVTYVHALATTLPRMLLLILRSEHRWVVTLYDHLVPTITHAYWKVIDTLHITSHILHQSTLLPEHLGSVATHANAFMMHASDHPNTGSGHLALSNFCLDNFEGFNWLLGYRSSFSWSISIFSDCSNEFAKYPALLKWKRLNSRVI